MFCPKCGSQIADDVAFCGNCGTKINAPQPSPAPGSPSTAQPAAYANIPQQQMPAVGQPAAYANIPQTPMPAVAGVPVPAAVPNGRPRKKLPIILILIIAVIVVAAALLVVPMLSPSPSYVITKDVTFNSSTGDWWLTQEYKRSENGAALSITQDMVDSDSHTVDYIDIGDGVTVSSSSTGSYEKNDDGDIIKISRTFQDGTSNTQTLSYYRPGIIKSVTTESATYNRVSTYDERGRIIEYLNEPTSNSKKTHWVYTYQEINSGNVLLRTCTSTSDDSEGEDSKSSTMRFVLGAHGYPVQRYAVVEDGEDILVDEITYDEVKEPATYIRATSRLLG